MQNYKDLDGNVHVLEDLSLERLLPIGCEKITQAEADEILAQFVRAQVTDISNNK